MNAPHAHPFPGRIQFAACLISLISALGASANDLPKLGEWRGSSLMGSGQASLPFKTAPYLPEIQWDQPVAMVRIPDSATKLVVERFGTLWLLHPEERIKEPFLSLLGKGAPPSGSGTPRLTLNAIFHNRFPAEPYLYLLSNEGNNASGINRLSRFEVTFSGDRLQVSPDSERVLLSWRAKGHRGGGLAFGPDGMLYISSGDGGPPGDPENVGQKVDNLLGSVLRIDVDQQDSEPYYRVPDDNPFVGRPGVHPEVWAYGLRNPWRMSFHPEEGTLWAGDNGDEHWEMLYRIDRGANYGWSAFEGNHPFRTSNSLAGPTRERTPPVVEQSHTLLRSIIGGLWYRGEAFPELKNHYLYGCHLTKRLWSIRLKAGQATSPRRLADTGGQITSFFEDDDKEIILVTLNHGLMRLVTNTDEHTVKPFPPTLSQTGLFESTASHTIASGILPYDVNLPVHWDGALRQRFMTVPAGKRVQLQARPPTVSKWPKERLRNEIAIDRWKMPEGTVTFQTFSLPSPSFANGQRRVETQVAYDDGGEWKFLTYEWRDDQSDADLVGEFGKDTALMISHKKTRKSWRFPGRTECSSCHTQNGMFVLGLTKAQLNRDYDYQDQGGGIKNQLEVMAALGWIPSGVTREPNHATRRLPQPKDKTFSLEERARAYLHVNCAHCHRETGLAGRASFSLVHWFKNEHTKTLNAPTLVGLPGLAPGEARIIAPGRPEHSEIVRRMATRGPGKMPLFGSHEIDPEGLRLIREWISSLPKE